MSHLPTPSWRSVPGDPHTCHLPRRTPGGVCGRCQGVLGCEERSPSDDTCTCTPWHRPPGQVCSAAPSAGEQSSVCTQTIVQRLGEIVSPWRHATPRQPTASSHTVLTVGVRNDSLTRQGHGKGKASSLLYGKIPPEVYTCHGHGTIGAMTTGIISS